MNHLSAAAALPDETSAGVVDVDWLSSLSLRLHKGRVVDSEFDDIYPRWLRLASTVYWTPISVAIRAAELLVQSAATRVLDVGSGSGKFCMVGAAMTGATFTGVEHRAHLVQTSRAAAARLGIDGARFLHTTFDTVDVSSFDAAYFFNPFEENVWSPSERLDDSVKHSSARFIDDIRRAEKLLTMARVGTRVVTFHGFGGDMPLGYHRVLRERHYAGALELWVKTAIPQFVRGPDSPECNDLFAPLYAPATSLEDLRTRFKRAG